MGKSKICYTCVCVYMRLYTHIHHMFLNSCLTCVEKSRMIYIWYTWVISLFDHNICETYCFTRKLHKKKIYITLYKADNSISFVKSPFKNIFYQSIKQNISMSRNLKSKYSECSIIVINFKLFKSPKKKSYV